MEEVPAQEGCLALLMRLFLGMTLALAAVVVLAVLL